MPFLLFQVRRLAVVLVGIAMVLLTLGGAHATVEPVLFPTAQVLVQNPDTHLGDGHHHDLVLSIEAEELLDVIEAEVEVDPEREAPVWGLLARTRLHVFQLTPHPKHLQRFEWPPVQVLQTRLELAFAARGPPHC